MLRTSSSSTIGIHVVTIHHTRLIHQHPQNFFVRWSFKLRTYSRCYTQRSRGILTTIVTGENDLERTSPDLDSGRIVDNAQITLDLLKWMNNSYVPFGHHFRDRTNINKLLPEIAQKLLENKESVDYIQPEPISEHERMADTGRTTRRWKQNRVNTASGIDVIEGFEYDPLLYTLSTTSSMEEAWQAYQSLRSRRNSTVEHVDRSKVPFILRHRLARLLGNTKPRTRKVFFRLRSLLSDMHNDGGRVHLWEWNTLIHCAGSGWRKTRIEDYRGALHVYNEMISTDSSTETSSQNAATNDKDRHVKPDIYTYTTLLDIAMRTHNSQALRHATSLLRSSGWSPNRVTLLSILRHRSQVKDLRGIQGTLERLAANMHDIGVDGVNSVLWFHARAGRFEVAWRIYESIVKNANKDAKVTEGAGALDMIATFPKDIEGLVVPDHVRPDIITFTLMIQALTYHGYFFEALDVWRDMLSVPKDITLSDVKRPSAHSRIVSIQSHESTVHIFRAFFCGFSKHGGESAILPPFSSRSLDDTSPWTFENLSNIFNVFLSSTEPGVTPNDRVLFWIMKGFAKTTNNDRETLESVWKELESKFDRQWSGRMSWLHRKYSRKDKTHLLAEEEKVQT